MEEGVDTAAEAALIWEEAAAVATVTPALTHLHTEAEEVVTDTKAMAMKEADTEADTHLTHHVVAAMLLTVDVTLLTVDVTLHMADVTLLTVAVTLLTAAVVTVVMEVTAAMVVVMAPFLTVETATATAVATMITERAGPRTVTTGTSLATDTPTAQIVEEPPTATMAAETEMLLKAPKNPESHPNRGVHPLPASQRNTAEAGTPDPTPLKEKSPDPVPPAVKSKRTPVRVTNKLLLIYTC